LDFSKEWDPEVAKMVARGADKTPNTTTHSLLKDLYCPPYVECKSGRRKGARWFAQCQNPRQNAVLKSCLIKEHFQRKPLANTLDLIANKHHANDKDSNKLSVRTTRQTTPQLPNSKKWVERLVRP
jgi:hypothetical protein